MASDSKGAVPSATLAQLFACDERTIRNLAGQNIVVKAGRGQYVLAQSIKNYVIHLREQAAGRMGADDKIDVVKEGALLKREQRRNVQLRNAILEGSAIAVEDIAPAWARVVRAVRAGVLAAPGKIRFRLPHISAHDEAVIDEVLRQALDDAAMRDEPPAIDGAKADLEADDGS
jgi:phage terminase Nu1 subunit (DNA packaging protein)